MIGNMASDLYKSIGSVYSGDTLCIKISNAQVTVNITAGSTETSIDIDGYIIGEDAYKKILMADTLRIFVATGDYVLVVPRAKLISGVQIHCFIDDNAHVSAGFEAISDDNGQTVLFEESVGAYVGNH